MGRYVKVGGFGGVAYRDRAGTDPPSLEGHLGAYIGARFEFNQSRAETLFRPTV
jgi:hypothetical protein